MKFSLGYAPLILAGLLISGCKGSSGESADPTAASPAAGDAASSSSVASTPAILGVEQKAGPFAITMTTDKARPEVGPVTFSAMVSSKNSGVSSATVKVAFTNTATKAALPQIELKNSTDNNYEGSVTFPAEGQYQAVVTVSANGQRGSVVYKFPVGAPKVKTPPPAAGG